MNPLVSYVTLSVATFIISGFISRPWFYLFGVFANTAIGLFSLFAMNDVHLSIAWFLLALFCLWRFWRGSKDQRRKAAALIGAKGRAIREKLVRNMPRVRTPLPKTV